MFASIPLFYLVYGTAMGGFVAAVGLWQLSKGIYALGKWVKNKLTDYFSLKSAQEIGQPQAQNGPNGPQVGLSPPSVANSVRDNELELKEAIVLAFFLSPEQVDEISKESPLFSSKVTTAKQFINNLNNINEVVKFIFAYFYAMTEDESEEIEASDVKTKSSKSSSNKQWYSWGEELHQTFQRIVKPVGFEIEKADVLEGPLLKELLSYFKRLLSNAEAIENLKLDRLNKPILTAPQLDRLKSYFVEYPQLVEILIQFRMLGLEYDRKLINILSEELTPPLIEEKLTEIFKLDGVSLLKSFLKFNFDLHSFKNQIGGVLHNAAFFGARECVSVLIEKKCDVFKLNRNDEYPIEIAAQRGCRSTIVRLLNAGSPTQFEGPFSLPLAHLAVRNRDFDSLQIYAKKKIDVNEVDANQRPPFYQYMDPKTEVAAPEVQIIGLFVQCQANLNWTDFSGDTVLITSIRLKRNARFIKQLFDSPTLDITYVNQFTGMSALHQTILSEDICTLNRLLEKGVALTFLKAHQTSLNALTNSCQSDEVKSKLEPLIASAYSVSDEQNENLYTPIAIPRGALRRHR